MSNVLFLSPRFPWPLVGGDRVKAYFLLRHLARNHKVVLVTYNHGAPCTEEQLAAMAGINVEVRCVPLSPVTAALNSVRTFWTGLPLEITFYTGRDFRKVVDEVLVSRKIDIGISFFMRTAEYLRYRQGLPRVLVAEDCRVQYMSRSHNVADTFIEKIVRWWELRKLRKYEPGTVSDFDITTFVSPEDVAAMRRQLPTASCTVVTNGVDLERFSFVDHQEQRSGVLFSGKMDTLANHIMGMTLVRDIMPEIRKVMPGVRFTMAGAKSRKALLEYASELNIIHNGVPEVVPFLHAGAVYIHPHKGASGIQNKILEAMATGIAIVTTPSGVQGIEAVHGEHCLIANTQQEMIDGAIRLLQSPELRSRLARNARRLMEETHSWGVVERQMDDVLHMVLNKHKVLPT